MTAVALSQQFPNRKTAWVDPETGIMNPVSHALLLSLWQRTGAGIATSTSTQMQAQITADGVTIVANTAAIAALPSIYAPLISPHLTGVPTAPTAAALTNTTQLATTAFVAAGFLTTATQITASLVADVALSNVGNFFTGPTIAQGTAGTWFASGAVSVQDTAGGALFNVKLWDGTTVIASGTANTSFLGEVIVVSLSGVIASPVGNIRISVQDTVSINGLIKFNISGAGKDATLTAFRVA